MQRTLECDVCTHLYDTGTRQPKSLLCGHGYCLVCIESMMRNGIIPCPKCREDCDVPQGKAKKLPTNFAILELLETVCKECQDRPHTKRCLHCSQNLCDDCHKAHISDFDVKVADLDELIKRLKYLEEEGKESRARINRQGEEVLQELEKSHCEKIKKLEEKFNRQVSEIQNKMRKDIETQEKWQADVKKIRSKAQSTRSKTSKPGSASLQDKSLVTEYTNIKSDLERVEHRKPSVTKVYVVDTPDDVTQSRVKFETPQASGNVNVNKVKEKYIQSSASYQRAGDYSQASYKDMVGKRGTGLGELKNPRGILVGLVDEILVADWLNDRLHVFDAELNAVRTIAIDGAFDLCKYNGYIFVTQNSARQITVVTDRGEILRVLGAESNHLQDPRGIDSDKKGLLYVCDSADKCIKVLKSSGEFIKEFGHDAFPDVGPRYIAISKSHIYASDNNYNLHTFDMKGKLLSTIKGGQPPNNLRITGIAVDAEDNLILSDSSGRLVVMKNGTQLDCMIGSNGRGRGQLRGPEGLTITGQGEVVVCDAGNDRLIMFSVPH